MIDSNTEKSKNAGEQKPAPSTGQATTGKATTGQTTTGKAKTAQTMADRNEQAEPLRFRDDGIQGLMLIGDPHLEARVPGFRKDEYPRTVLGKLRWCLETARSNRWLPVLLGDLFQLPRDNPNWMIVELLELFDQPVFGIYGNHDVHENVIDENDSLSILAEAGRINILQTEKPVGMFIGDRPVILGGTSWGQPLPDSIPEYELPAPFDQSVEPTVVWVTHHDLIVPGYEQAGKIRVKKSLPIDLIVNGHIHRRLDPVQFGRTTVMTPGNITRRKRSDMTREHVPSVLVVDFDSQGWNHRYVEVPHRSFDDVFHPPAETPDENETVSGFVTGLAELQARKTETGAGLSAFLAANTEQFGESVAAEIQLLAAEVLDSSTADNNSNAP